MLSIGSMNRTTLPAKPTQEASLCQIDPLNSKAWSQLLDSPDASLFHSPEWMRVIAKTYDMGLGGVVLQANGQPVAGAAWTTANDILGDRWSSLVCSDFCDILAPNEEAARAVGHHVVKHAPRWGLRTRTRNAVSLDVPGRTKSSYALQTIDLRPIETEMWTSLSSMARRGVRKAQREGVTVRLATNKAELREWFLLHLRLRRGKHNLLAQPFAFFENIWDDFIEPGNGFLLLAIHDDQIIAGDLFLTWRDQCYYKSNASVTSLLSLRPNNLLLWHGMLEAKARGCVSLDLGRSPRDNAGLIAFKQGFGAVEESVINVDYDKDAEHRETRREDEARLLLRTMTRLFAREDVSEPVAEEAGAYLYRYFV